MKNNKKNYEIGFVGGGIDSAISGIHLRSILLNSKWKLSSGFFSLNKKNNEVSAIKYGIKKNRVFYNLDDFLENESKKLAAIIIITPIPNRYDVIKKILKYKVPIICEKPLLSNLTEAKKIKKIIKNKFLTVTYNYTGYPMVRELKHLILEKNFFGKILNINIEMPSGIFLEKKSTVNNISWWRLKDYFIPTVALDLGSHVFNLIFFLTNSHTKKIIAHSSSHGKFKNIIDDMTGFGILKNNITFNIWFSKSALGYDNGLKIRVFGKKASATWNQNDPEKLNISDNNKNNFVIDRGSYKSLIGKKSRYNIFKSGHPTGFLEAFSNLYEDIFSNLENYIKKNKIQKNHYVFDINHAIYVLKSLEAMQFSILKKQWVKIK